MPTKLAHEPEPEIELATSPTSVEDTLAARRARRQEIMAKYAGLSSVNTSQEPTPSPGPSSAVLPLPALSAPSDNLSQPQSALATPEMSELRIASSEYRDPLSKRQSSDTATGKRESMSTSPAPDSFALAKEEEEEAQVNGHAEDGNREQISAADYDPSLDRREDEKKMLRGVQDGHSDDVEVIEEEEEEEDVDDMFAALTSEKKVKKVKKVVVRVPHLGQLRSLADQRPEESNCTCDHYHNPGLGS